MSFKSKRKSKKFYRRNKTRSKRRKYSNKKRVKRVTRKQKVMRGGMDPPGKSQRTEKDQNAALTDKQEGQQQEQISRDILLIINKYYSRSLIKTFRDAGYTIELNAQNQWEIQNYPQITYLNAKLPYILRALSSVDRSLINTALSTNNLTNLSPEIIQIILAIVSSNNSGCDFVRNPIIEQQPQYIKDSLSQYIGKVGTIVSDDGLRVDTSDGMKSVANVRVIVPELLPQAIILDDGQIITPLSPGLYKVIKKQDNSIKIAPSNIPNFSLIEFMLLTLLYPDQEIFVANMDKILPKVRLLASFGQRTKYDEWFQFLQKLARNEIRIDDFSNGYLTTFQSSRAEIVTCINQINLADYLNYPGWDRTILSIYELSHPCLNEGITDVYYAGEFCVICDAEGNCYLTNVRPYSGHYKPSMSILLLILRDFVEKGYNLVNYGNNYLVPVDKQSILENCTEYDPTAQQPAGSPVPFTGPLPLPI